MKSLLHSLFFSLLWVNIQAQAIQITEAPNTSGNSVNEFLVAGHTLNIKGASPAFMPPSVSADINVVTGITAAARAGKLEVYDGAGNGVKNYEYGFQSTDASVKVYSKPEGGIILRENIANFLIFDTYGEIKHSVSNSSQSREGEAISELASDPLFKTIVLYNPKIISGGIEGSRAGVVQNNGSTDEIFYSDDRAIRFVDVTDDGQFVGIVSYKPGTDDELLVTDRFGNQLNRFSFDQNIAGFRLSDDGRFVTVRSNSRVVVFSVVDGQRIGSTSFRSRLYFAEYIPADETIIALSGDKAGTTLSNVELHAINIAERAVQRQEYNGTLGTTELIPLQLERTGTLSYNLTGLSKTLSLTVRF